MAMSQVEAAVADAPGTRLSDRSACPNCGELLIGPKTSSYLGLGRIAHSWQCDGCGSRFETKGRLAGLIDGDGDEADAANEQRAA